jgi:hypothetical protein
MYIPLDINEIINTVKPTQSKHESMIKSTGSLTMLLQFDVHSSTAPEVNAVTRMH